MGIMMPFSWPNRSISRRMSAVSQVSHIPSQQVVGFIMARNCQMQRVCLSGRRKPQIGVQFACKFPACAVDHKTRQALQQRNPLLRQSAFPLQDLVLDHPRNEKAVFLPFFFPPSSRSDLVRRCGQEWAKFRRRRSSGSSFRCTATVSCRTPQLNCTLFRSRGKPQPYLRLRLPFWKISSITRVNCVKLNVFCNAVHKPLSLVVQQQFQEFAPRFHERPIDQPLVLLVGGIGYFEAAKLVIGQMFLASREILSATSSRKFRLGSFLCNVNTRIRRLLVF